MGCVTMGKHLEFTLNQVANYLVDKFSEDFELSKTETRKYFIDALTYNVVVEAIWEQMNFLIYEGTAEGKEK